ncbi:putative molybdenum carrier protein [Thiohalocapsa sp.]|uniref:putative molybdenum carrier protein n=1 Tax=Thiohalocapsa sp. TaxID=2497641 RepID=UPI0025ED75E8|nr:putative molybdenum carrier protein [Thiohalocapsa sp.]
MSNLPDKLRLKEQAEEDQYFARRDRELVAALHARRGCPVARVVSGGQTGVDRAALDAALAAGVPVGGWCPRGRLAEDGVLPARYPLCETPDADPAQRTEWNVRDSDGTLILHRGPITGGTALTAELARRYGRPLLAVDLDTGPTVAAIRAWLDGQGIRVLNIAGPRESQAPRIAAAALDLLRQLLGERPERVDPA